MKKLIFAIIATFLVSGVFAQASAKKTPMYFAGAHYGTPVINYLPFNDAKGDTIFYVAIPAKDLQIPTSEKGVAGIVFIFTDTSIIHSMIREADTMKFVLHGIEIEPLTDWGKVQKKASKGEISAKAFDELKLYRWVKLTSVEKEKKPVGSFVDLGANAELIKKGVGPNGETNGRWTLSPFGGWTWTPNK